MTGPGESTPPVRRAIRGSLHAAARLAFSRQGPRSRVNRRYRRWSLPGKRRFHRYFAKAFRRGAPQVEPGDWRVEFAGRAITMPLRPERIWLDWDNALSIVGHDVEVKETYENCLRSPDPPELFCDIGANYGLHSLLFLLHGVETITFEPNPACHEDFGVLCSRNGVRGRIEGIALGERRGEVELVYPDRETWLGTVRSGPGVWAGEGMRAERVPQRTLDDYAEELGGRRLLIKIDTEGAECEVLRGGARTVQALRPPIVVETLGERERSRLHDLLAEWGYGVASLPWNPQRPVAFLERPEFLGSAAENFIAVPRD